MYRKKGSRKIPIISNKILDILLDVCYNKNIKRVANSNHLGKETDDMDDWIVKVLQAIAYILIAVYNVIKIWKEIRKKD